MQKLSLVLLFCCIPTICDTELPPTLIENVALPTIPPSKKTASSVVEESQQEVAATKPPENAPTSGPSSTETIAPTTGSVAQEITTQAATAARDALEVRDLRASYQQSAIMQNIRKLKNIIVRHDLTKRAPLAFSFSGYIKEDTFFDSRQVIGLRQDQFLYYPDHYLPDICGRDINDKGRFNMVSIETRGRGEAAGPLIIGAHSFGAMEADFWGGIEPSGIIGIFRLRHAFLYLVWPDKTLLLGQYWHPVFLPDCYPDTISFSNGVPIEPYAREPQIRFTKTFDKITLMFAATSYATNLYDQGVNVAANAINNLAERNAIMPDLNLQARATINDHFLGIGVNCRRIIPFLVTTPLTPTTGRRTKQDLFSFLGLAYAKFAWENITLAMKMIYAQNGLIYDMISGYAAHCVDPVTLMKDYTNLQCVSFWIDLVRHGIWEPGLFVGITKNLGASTTIIPETAYANGREDIDYVARIEPRLRWFIDPFIFGGEFEITRAAWGNINDRGRVQDAHPVTNYRALFAAFFCF